MAATEYIRNPRVRRYPELTAFYGIGPEVLHFIPNWLIDLYLDEMPRLQAERQRWSGLCALYGSAEAGDFRKEMDEYWDSFIPNQDPGGDRSAAALVEAGMIDPEEHKALLASMGISMDIVGVIHPPEDHNK